MLPRFRVLLLSVSLTVTGLGLEAAPVARPASDTAPETPFTLPLPFNLGPQTALASYCASNASFTGKLTQQLVNSGTPSTAGRITSPSVYGWISNVDAAWSCTLYRRYSGLVWNTTPTKGKFQWGTLINSTSVACNWGVGSTDYLKANDTTTCPSTDTAQKLTTTLSAERVYQQDGNHNSEGDISFAHSDCDITPYYGAAPSKGGEGTAAQGFGSADDNRPGNNCDPIDLDGFGASPVQVVTYDATPPVPNFTAPAVVGPVVVPSAFYTVAFTPDDNVAGINASGWSLQRQKAAWSGTACGTWSNDGSPATGTATTAQLIGQSLELNTCYHWVFSATDLNGNAGSTTSGSIRTDTSGVLGLQGHLGTESWDLGAGDSLAVSTGSGNVVLRHPVVSLPIRGSSVSVNFVYNSQDGGSVGFGPGWRLDMQRRLTVNAGGTVTFTDGTGARFTFTAPVVNGSTTTYTRPPALYANLVKNGTTSFTLTYRDQSTDTFTVAGTEGLLTREQDRFGNGVTLAYVSGTSRISTITDTAAGRTIDFAYDGSNLPTSITDWAYVSGGVVQATATGLRRKTCLYYSGSSLSGWTDGAYAYQSGSCPGSLPTDSHATRLTVAGGMVTQVTKTQTYETLVAGALGTGTRAVTTAVSYSGADVASVTDAAGGSAQFTHPATAALIRAVGQTQVIRAGTPASTTVYTLASQTDPYGRATSVKRLLGTSTWIEERTAYDASYPVEPASVTANYVGTGVPADATPDQNVATSYTYVGSSMGLVSRMTEPLTASTHRTTDHTYNANNDVTQTITALDGSASIRTVTRFCYDASCTLAGTSPVLLKRIDNYKDGAAGGAAGNVEDVTTSYQYDTDCAGGATCGQRVRETRANYDASGTPLDQAATGWTFDGLGNQTAEIRNYANGQVTSLGDDVTPNTTGARTDVTTAFTSDTAGNRVSTADPRRAVETAKSTSLGPDDFISRAAYDPLGLQLTTRQPTTPTVSDCSPAPGCRTTTSAMDEFGDILMSTDANGVVVATAFDAVERVIESYQDDDGSGTAAAPRVTGRSQYDAAGRPDWSEDAVQANDQAGGDDPGRTEYVYDTLGQTLQVTEAVGSSPDAATATTTGFDDLGRRTVLTTGGLQTTATGYDLGGRTVRTDDEFTCTTTAYDYRDLATQTIEGLASGTCSGGTPVTTTVTSDGLGRLTLRHVDTANEPEAHTYDAAGNTLSTTGKQAGTTTTSTYSLNPLDQVVSEVRSDGSTSKTTYDPSGNPVDRCTWSSTPAEACHDAVTAFANPQPATASSTVYDAQNQRISQTTRIGGASTAATTTYDPLHNFQISAFYLATHYDAQGRRDAEGQDLYTYDARHRLATITHQQCAVSAGTDTCTGTVTPAGSSSYGYDDNDNRISVTESSTGGTATTRTYCYDPRNQLIASNASTPCAGSPDEVYTFDDAGNRLSAGAPTGTPVHGSRTFSYATDGQLDSCSNPTCSVTYDDAGRTATLTDNGVSWTFIYEADGRLVSACRSTSCSGSIQRVDYLYDGDGHRTRITTTDPAASPATVATDLRYAGDTVVAESVGGTVTRTYATDETGRIVQVCDPECATGTVYLVAWNGHGDATGLWREESGGGLTLANSYTYSTWGTPTTATHNGYGDLGFSFLYVGAHDVQWDNAFGLGLYYMHARHYSPALGRFLQPDPARAEANLYAYAAENPVTRTDACGTFGLSDLVDCSKLRKEIERFYRELQDRADELREDAGRMRFGGLVWGRTLIGERIQYEGWRRGLLRRLYEFVRRNCGGPPPSGAGMKVPAGAWKAATTGIPRTYKPLGATGSGGGGVGHPGWVLPGIITGAGAVVIWALAWLYQAGGILVVAY
ncbi:MAG: RHS repeat-associated core domain-containing protein [Chloroflexota bacterium]